MYKNLSPRGLVISGRQSELIELALTYAFGGLEVDMVDMLKRSQRSSFEEASKYLRAADIEIGTFNLPVDLDADDDSFKAAAGALVPLSELAARLGALRATLTIPPATDRLPYHEYFDQIRARVSTVAQTLHPHGIRLGLTFEPGVERAEGKEFAFVRNVEGYLATVNSLTEENVGFTIDTWSWHVGSGGMDQLDEVDGKRVVSVRMSDLAGTVSQNEAKSSDRVLPSVGGLINHAGILKKLAADGFRGPVTPQVGTGQLKGQTREAIVARAQEQVDAIFGAAGLPVPQRPMDTIDESAEPMMMGED